jgi:hypothetical protein
VFAHSWKHGETLVENNVPQWWNICENIDALNDSFRMCLMQVTTNLLLHNFFMYNINKYNGMVSRES